MLGGNCFQNRQKGFFWEVVWKVLVNPPSTAAGQEPDDDGGPEGIQKAT